MKFEEIWPRGFRGEVVQRCGQTDGRTDGRWREGRRVITIAENVKNFVEMYVGSAH